jgi:dTDP-4-dehydrorhamnose reductase
MAAVREGSLNEELEPLAGQTIVITGAGGMLGAAFHEALEAVPECRVLACDKATLDVTNRTAVLALARERPDVILHCAGDVNADRCERHPERCREVHLGGTANVIALAAETGARVVYPQSVFVFDGRELPVTEDTVPNPLSEYGRSKWAAEQQLMQELPRSLVVRMAGFFGGDARDKNFVGTFTTHLFGQIANGERSCRVGDRIWQPSYTKDLAGNMLLLVALERSGVYHMGAHDEGSFFDVASVVVEALGLTPVMTILPLPPVERAGLELAPRPHRMITANHRLKAEGLDRQRHWREALVEYLSRPFFQSRAKALLSEVT